MYYIGKSILRTFCHYQNFAGTTFVRSKIDRDSRGGFIKTYEYYFLDFFDIVSLDIMDEEGGRRSSTN